MKAIHCKVEISISEIIDTIGEALSGDDPEQEAAAREKAKDRAVSALAEILVERGKVSFFTTIPEAREPRV